MARVKCRAFTMASCNIAATLAQGLAWNLSPTVLYVLLRSLLQRDSGFLKGFPAPKKIN